MSMIFCCCHFFE